MARSAALRVVGATVALGALTSVVTSMPSAAVSPIGGAFIRVDQVGYPESGPKVAYLLSSRPEPGAEANVVAAAGAAVASVPVGPPVGAWNHRYRYVYRLDFSAVTKGGRYSIDVPGPVTARSPTFAVGPADSVYSPALANALSFYENERDGPDFIPSALRRAPAHLNDEHAMTYLTKTMNADGGFTGDLTPLDVTIDASGGWFDAGDYLKFVETTSYVETMMLTGIDEFPSLLGPGSAHADFTAEARFGLTWLMKMWDEKTRTLYYQVGIGSGNRTTRGDHDIWRLPQADDTYGGKDPVYRYIRNRPVFRAGPPGSKISPNLAGRLAADFALCSLVYRKAEPTFAATCLRDAETVYGLADVSPRGRLLTTDPHGFYPETSWQDDLELGATELYRAVAAGGPLAGLPDNSADYYLHQAATWAHAYITGPEDDTDTLNLYDVSGLAHFELDRAIKAAGDPPGLAVTRGQLLADFGRQLHGAVLRAKKDPFGFGYPWARSDTVSHGAGLSVMASEYDSLTRSDTYATQAQGWMDNILGANAWGASFIVGDGTTFPDCMQHQVANLAGSLNGTPPVLAGAAVEGPTSYTTRGRLPHMRQCPVGGGDRYAQFDNKALYKDNVQSYSTDEPAIDLTAASPLAFAWLSSSSAP
jgi:endoglucanase